MRRADKIRLGLDIENPKAIPVVARTRDLHLLLAVPRARVVPVVAHVAPHVACAVDE